MRNGNGVVKNLVVVLLLTALLIPMLPAVRADGIYNPIDFSQEVLSSRINQRVSGGCAVAAMATVESYMHGVTSDEDKETVYNAVKKANGSEVYAYWANVGYTQYNYIDWEVIYQRLTMGLPSIIHRTKGINSAQHWAVVAGYQGDTAQLEEDQFIVVDLFLGEMTDIKTTGTWGYGCDIDWMALRRSGLNIAVHDKTLVDLGKSFYAYISRVDTPNERLSVGEDSESTGVFAAATDNSARQYWLFTYQSDGGYIIESVHNGGVLGIQDDAPLDGIPVEIQENLDGECQHWFIYRTENGYMLQSRGTGKALTVFPASTGRSAAIYTYNQSAAQMFLIHVHTDEEKTETTPMYRLYNSNSGEHFYTGSLEERDNLIAVGWQYEGVAWNAPTQAGAPVYRVYNPNSGDHHYTMSLEEVDMLTGLGWQYEGVAWNSAGSDDIPQYRLYNPNADCGSHHYTSSIEEKAHLENLGWIYEGIGWYGMLK